MAEASRGTGTIRVGMVGAGGIARRHLEVLATEEGVEVVAHLGRSAGPVAAQARRYGGRVAGDIGEMLGDVHAVWVCVTPDGHGAIEEVLVERGVPFFVEKPLAADAETPERLAVAIEGAGLPVAVGYHWRALDTLDDVRAALGDRPPHLVVGAWHGSTPGVEWWRRQARSGGQMVEQATHLLDLARWLVGEAEVVGARATAHPRPAFPDADVADVSAALLRYASGATGTFTATCLLGRAETIGLSLYAEGIAVRITQEAVTIDDGRERREVRTRADPFVTEDRAFLDAVRSGDATRVVSSYGDALLTHRLAVAIRDAAEGGESAEGIT